MPPRKQSAKALQAAREKWVATYTKAHGEGTLDTSGKDVDYEFISSGSLDLDAALGGGFVEGRLVEIWGVDAIGKTTLAIQTCAEAQRKHPDKLVFWVDMEHTFDKPWARLNGMDTSKNGLYLELPNSAEEVADKVKDAIRSGLFSVVVIDSIGAMIPEAEKEKDADEAVVANQAKIVTRMVKIAAVEGSNSSTLTIMLNQVRAAIGAYGADTTTGGGFALKHVTTHKVKLSRASGGADSPVKPVKVAGQTKPVEVGYEIAALTERNKIAPPKRRATWIFIHTESERYGPVGVDKVDEAARVGTKMGVISQKGGWYTLPGGQRVNGMDAVREALRGDEDLVQTVREQVLAVVSGDLIPGEESDPLADPEVQAALAEGDEPATAEGGASLADQVSVFPSLTDAMAGRE